MASLMREVSLMPITSRTVIATTISAAGTLRSAPVVDQAWVSASKASGALIYSAGIVMPKSFAKLTT